MVLPQRQTWSYRKDQYGLTVKTGKALGVRFARCRKRAIVSIAFVLWVGVENDFLIYADVWDSLPPGLPITSL